MNSNLSLKAWIELAHRDLIAAKELLQNEYLANIVLFHCQQTIEKLLKACLEKNNIKPPRTHSINKLFSVIPEDFRRNISLSDEEMNLIDDIYIDTRYPSSFGILPSGFPNKKDAEKVFKIAERTFQEIVKIID